MSDDIIFVDGLMYKPPHEKAPDFVKGKLSFKLKEFFEFAKQHQHDGWLNAEMKVSKNGKIYFQLDTWKPTKQGFDPATGTGSDPMPSNDVDQDIPF